jgi:hypothetical protein
MTYLLCCRVSSSSSISPTRSHRNNTIVKVVLTHLLPSHRQNSLGFLIEKQAHPLSIFISHHHPPTNISLISVEIREMSPACAACKARKCRCTHHAAAASSVPDFAAPKTIIAGSVQPTTTVTPPTSLAATQSHCYGETKARLQNLTLST